MGRGRGKLATLALLLVATAALAEDGAVEPAIVVRAVRPDQQAEAVIRLFEGSRAAHPAAAMAAWRRATGDANALGKPIQAVAAMFNPEMTAEWRAFQDAELVAGLDLADGWQWFATVPHDGGEIAALVTSLRLSGGADEPPLGEPPLAVQRLGGPGAAMAAVSPGGTVFGSRRPELAEALARLRAPLGPKEEPTDLLPLTAEDSGFRLVFEPGRLPGDFRAAPNPSRLLAAAKSTGLEAVVGFLSLRDDHLGLDLASRFDPARPTALLKTPPIDPAWLAWMPSDSTQAAVALALGREPAFRDALFDVVDRIDRADPARAQLQPLRVRLNLLATVRGVRLEADLWPLLRGASLATFADPEKPGTTSGALLALHTDRSEDADSILRRVVLPLAPLFGGSRPANGPAEAVATLGRASGRPVEAVASGTTVLVGWGEGAVATALKSAQAPERSVAGLIGGDESRPVGRAGVFWPGRAGLPIPGGDDPASPLAATLAESAPVVWRGGWEGGRAWDVIRWGDLRRSVARFLERVPQAPPEAP
ncbi:hypothetical protein [Planctomyces sp. SH-PL62]|uniref:hypothetical protein n=1 Tax=Planctomyces sp. SH-PL62 TaxID=1636152 RepID=UPI0008395E90|nr:hypothetical protein [Planctomyces sp. SH-PL62]